MRAMSVRGRKQSVPTQPSLFAMVEETRDSLDRLLAQLADEPRGAAHYDALETWAASIADALKGAFRLSRRNRL